MIGLDTNVIARLLTNDDPEQTARARRAIATVEKAGEPILLDDVVLAETAWAMRTRYRARRAQIAAMARSLIETPAFVFENRDAVERALALYLGSTADYSDCLIVAKNEALGARSTWSFDEDFRVLPATRLL